MCSKKVPMKILISLIVVLLVSTFNNFAQQASTDFVGVIDDNYEVNALGSYNHFIPIHVAPGVNGMEPKIALVYDSRSGFSEMGFGWTISGLSKIARGGNNIAQHGKIDGINFNSKDAILFDGQLLTCVSGTNASVSSKYKTENESNVLIIASDQALSQGSASPDFFTVKQPNGLTYFYGANSNSKVVLNIDGSQEVLEWNVSKIEDAYGNQIDFAYQVFDNISRISSITYTSNHMAGILPKGKVYFRYFDEAEVKRKQNVSYLKGNKFINNNLLRSIEIEADGNIFKYYNLKYCPDQNKLVSITECSSDDPKLCLPETIFEYDNSSKLIFSAPQIINFPESRFDLGNYSTQSRPKIKRIRNRNYPPIIIEVPEHYLVPKNVRYVSEDFNLNGTKDLIVMTALRTGDRKFQIKASIYTNVNNEFRFEQDVLISTGEGIREYKDIDLNKVLINDFNGDGLLDIMTQSHILLNRSSDSKITFEASTIKFQDAAQSAKNTFLVRSVDLNGDRKSEIVVFNYSKKNECEISIYSVLDDKKVKKLHSESYKNIISTISSPDDIACTSSN